MPKKLEKSLLDYPSKTKKPAPQVRLPSKSLSSSTSWILRGCSRPRTLSFAVDHYPNNEEVRNNDDAATLADIDRFLFENFKSLYQEDSDNEQEEKSDDKNVKEKSVDFVFESSRFIDPPLDLCGSNRFFVTPSTSSSLMEDARSSSSAARWSMTAFDEAGTSSTTTTTTTMSDSTKKSNNAKDTTGSDDFIAVLTYSPNPHNDFQHSMQEMIQARVRDHGKVNWEFMEELLFCYLNLNNKKSYKYILSAFVDLIVVLRQNSGKITVPEE